ncbi:hypothetical protein PPERSA_07111 [Pseudocohnilembus persalinus]|uniref:Uncharacterized protein n=1 Tax=Pseudocohnilembus persalinus TaxID=266149 RepID=A0A0V0QXM4_PSEPJ|nr:hypothetical protein PPERSA_07111 [Pseudocohnilembus persalinus]|eukprot:KRX06948.1 hypothetical protein PPERSA_07111 [Pseudocohnilembus persalinus]
MESIKNNQDLVQIIYFYCEFQMNSDQFIEKIYQNLNFGFSDENQKISQFQVNEKFLKEKIDLYEQIAFGTYQENLLQQAKFKEFCQNNQEFFLDLKRTKKFMQQSENFLLEIEKNSIDYKVQQLDFQTFILLKGLEIDLSQNLNTKQEINEQLQQNHMRYLYK